MFSDGESCPVQNNINIKMTQFIEIWIGFQMNQMNPDF